MNGWNRSILPDEHNCCLLTLPRIAFVLLLMLVPPYSDAELRQCLLQHKLTPGKMPLPISLYIMAELRAFNSVLNPQFMHYFLAL
jgi:hypothetical protein